METKTRVIRRCRADQVHDGEFILYEGKRRQVTGGRGSQRWILLWFDWSESPNPGAEFLEDERVTVIA